MIPRWSISPIARRRPDSCMKARTTTTSRRASACRGTSTGDGRTAVRGGYGLYYATNSSQNLIVTVTNPPDTPRVVYQTPTFPNPPFERTSGLSIRPVQWDVETPSIHVWNVNVQRELGAADRDHARLRRLARTATCCAATISTPRRRRPAPMACRSLRRACRASTPRGRPSKRRPPTVIPGTRRSSSTCGAASRPAGRSRVRTPGPTPKTRRRPRRSSRTRPTARPSAFPEFIPDYNRGPSDFNVRHNLVANATWEVPWQFLRRGRRVAVGLARVGDRHVSQRLSADRVRAEQPLAIAVAAVARSRHRPRSAELRAGLRRRRTPSPANPDAVVQPAGVRAAAGRHVRQHRPRRVRGAGPAHGGPVVLQGCAADRRAAASSSGSRSSTCSTAPTSACRT